MGTMIEDLATMHPAILFSAAVGLVAICQFGISLLLSLFKFIAGKKKPESPIASAKSRIRPPPLQLSRTPSAGTQQKRSELSMWQRHQALISRDDQSPQQPIDSLHTHGRAETLDGLNSRQKRIRQIMTGSAESPKARYQLPETTIQEESLSRTSSNSETQGEASPTEPFLSIPKLRLKKPEQRERRMPAFIKRTGSGVRSAEGAVDTPISSPLSSPRRTSREPDMPSSCSALPAPVIPFGRTASNSHVFLPRSSSSVAFEAMMEDDDSMLSFQAGARESFSRWTTEDTEERPVSPICIARVPSAGIAPYRAGSSQELDILEELRGVLDVGLPGAKSSIKDDLRNEKPEDFEERRGRSQRPKTLYWQKKTYAPGNWITRGTESPTRDLSPQRAGYELQERSVSPVRLRVRDRGRG